MPEQSSPVRRQPYFIGIDSDGTVFDTMEIKHKRVFQPLALEIWGLQSYQTEFYRIAENINLYSVHRGVNRFQGLVMAFERLAEQSESARKAVAGVKELRDFVLSGAPMSPGALVEYNATRRSHFLDQVLDWSQRSDDLYAQIMEREGNPAYPLVRETLAWAYRNAEIMVVSSSAREALMQDWGHEELLPLTTRVMGQDVGSKITQLKSALPENFVPTRALMMGDAMGDLEAARAHNILFYPILPGAEPSSWKRFKNEAIERFFLGTYAGEYQQQLLDEFATVLQPDDPWPRQEQVLTCASATI